VTTNDETVLRTSIRPPEDGPESPTRKPEAAIPGVALGACLGRGGMAVVYEGFDSGFRPARHVAIKLMDSTLSSDADYRARFEREAAIVANFRHDNIVRVFASGETQGAKYIVMEYLGGGTLSQKLERGSLGIVLALQIAAGMADALAYSHKRGVVHRDFKPGNILFTEDGKPVLSDFGVAKDLSGESTELTQGVVAIGAPKYMPPEQLRGEPVTDRADVYSWGLTLFQMLTGDLPTGHARVQRETADSGGFAALIPGASRPVAELVCRCLQADSFLRPAAQECHAVLVEELRRIPLAKPSQKPVRFVLWTIGAIATILVGGALYLGLFKPSAMRQPAPPPHPAPMSPATTTPSAATGAAPATVATTTAERAMVAPATVPTTTAATVVATNNLCGLPASARSVDALVKEGLEAQVNLTFAASEADQKSAADTVRRTADCLRKLRQLGYETPDSRRWISEAEAALTQAAGTR
jgi:serine/threonine protein kinase